MSKRHNMVTRKDVKTEYSMTILTADGKKVLTGVEYGRITETQLKARESAKLEAGKALLLDLTITAHGEHLFGMPKEQYFSGAIVLD